MALTFKFFVKSTLTWLAMAALPPLPNIKTLELFFFVLIIRSLTLIKSLNILLFEDILEAKLLKYFLN